MASGGHGPYEKRANNCNFSNNPSVDERRRRDYTERETHPIACGQQHQTDVSEITPISQNIHLENETSSLTRRLSEIAEEIAREEDSATVESSPPQRGPRKREQLEESEKKLECIRARKEEISQLFESMRHLQTVDLCFLVDCTGSMDPYIAEVKVKIESLVAYCQNVHRDLSLKVAFVGYRDHDDQERILSLKFTADIASFKSFVSKIQAGGGGDAAEDVFGGLEEAGKLQWTAPTRILFHVADAPCHGRQYHDDVLDDYPNGDPRGLNARDLLKVLEDHNIKYWFAKLTDKTDKMITAFQRVLKMPSRLEQIKLESAEELIFAVADSVSTSIRDMESTTLAEAAIDALSRDNNTVVQRPAEVQRRNPKTFEICKEIPEWNTIPVENAYIFRNKLPKKFTGDIKQPLQEECRQRRIQIAPRPFAEGTQRIVYYGIDCTFDIPKKVVFKEFKYSGKGLNKLESYKQQMGIQSISFFLAQEFNKQKPAEAKAILFTKVIVTSFHERAKPFYCSQEPLIQGPYTKYNSNNGFVNKDEYAASLNAFSHWTHQATNGYLMVVDLQGVKVSTPGGTRFTLTDPALHCKDVTRFSGTNLGNQGMHRFFRSHHCNSICEAMKLQPHRHQPGSVIQQGTVVKF